jgi:type II secretory pathway pseudopilin PulG
MKSEIRVTGGQPSPGFGTAGRWQVIGTGLRRAQLVTCHASRVTAFTLVEVLVTMVLLSLIVLSLMVVFNSTQKAFRASLTQTDVLESGRLVMNLMTSDLEGTVPSLGGHTNTDIYLNILPGDAVNFYANTNFGYPPLLQALTASSQLRTNVLENFFSLSRQNLNGSPSWVGTGYTVMSNLPDGTLYPLYRFYMATNVMNGNPERLFSNFLNDVFYNNFTNNSTNWSHLMDGVVDLQVRAYAPQGFLMTNNANQNTFITTNQNTVFLFSNTIPASVDLELGVMEDAILARAEGLAGAAQLNYLSNHAGQVHLFRQRVLTRNVDPAAYQ